MENKSRLSLKSKPTTLLIEDDPEFLKALSGLLENHGVNFVTAQDGVEGVMKCKNQKFSAIICDLDMPKMRGDDAIAFIRKSELNGETPILVLSGRVDSENVNRIQGKVQRVLVKPAEGEKIISFIRQNTGIKVQPNNFDLDPVSGE